MKKIKINMLSYAESIEGQGVGSAYIELIKLLKSTAKKEIDIEKNKGLKYDIMHSHTMDPISHIKQRLSKGIALSTVHFMPETLQGALKLPKFVMNIYAWWVKYCYMKSDHLVVVNPNYIESMNKFGFNKDNITYIPNYISSEKFYPMDKKKILKYRKKYGFKEDDFVVISVGQLHKGKGALDFFECAKKNPDLKFMWVGGFTFGHLMEGYEEIKKIYDKPYDNLKFTGIVPHKEVNVFCNISDVFFLPSYMESFALVAVEAAKTYKPIVLRDLDEYRNIYFDNYLKGNTNKEFCDILRKLKEDKEEYNKYKKCSKKISDFYSKENISKMWIDLYKKLMIKNNQDV